MKVLHTGNIDVNSGGPAMSTYLALKGLRDLGVDAQVAMYPMDANGKLRGEEVPVTFLKEPWKNRFKYYPSLTKDLINIGDFDIYQAQGVWLYRTYATVNAAKKTNKPYIITPRGMLYPQDLSKGTVWFKKMLLKTKLVKAMNNAACMHVTCHDEMKHCRNLGVTSPMAIIPNPVEIEEHAETKNDDVFRVGYLGRISRRKNVEGLIYALDNLRDKVDNIELLVIGGGDDVYEQFLKDEVKRLELRNVRFTGFLSGKEKDEAIASCSMLAMPSEFENMGNVILEGLIRGIPCLATKGAPWEDLETSNCGWWVEYKQEAITDAIYQAYNTPKEKMRLMGENGKKLMKDKYSVESVAAKLKQTYEWILGQGERPEFVYTE